MTEKNIALLYNKYNLSCSNLQLLLSSIHQFDELELVSFLLLPLPLPISPILFHPPSSLFPLPLIFPFLPLFVIRSIYSLFTNQLDLLIRLFYPSIPLPFFPFLFLQFPPISSYFLLYLLFALISSNSLQFPLPLSPSFSFSPFSIYFSPPFHLP